VLDVITPGFNGFVFSLNIQRELKNEITKVNRV